MKEIVLALIMISPVGLICYLSLPLQIPTWLSIIIIALWLGIFCFAAPKLENRMKKDKMLND